MSVTKELIEQERQQVQAGRIGDVHLHKEGSFLRAYNWSAWLCCRYLHEFKVTKRAFRGVNEPVAYIGFPETSFFVYPYVMLQEKAVFFCGMTENHYLCGEA